MLKLVSPEVLAGSRTQKIFLKSDPSIRRAALDLFVEASIRLMPRQEAEEYGRYLSLCDAICLARPNLDSRLQKQLKRVPQLSLSQMIIVGGRTLRRVVSAQAEGLPDLADKPSTAENERRIHTLGGMANDVGFAVLRALNELSARARSRDLRRPDAIAKGCHEFLPAMTIASQINSLDFIVDSASFGDFTVDEVLLDGRGFTLGYADAWLVLIRQLNLRRRLIHRFAGRRGQRLVSDMLSRVHPDLLLNALGDLIDATGAPSPSADRIDKLVADGDKILLDVDAEDDLLMLAAGRTIQPSMMYHVSAALRWHALAGDLVAELLPGRRAREFSREIRLQSVQAGLRAKDLDSAAAAWEALTTILPARSHFDLLRRPFVRTRADTALPLMVSEDPWTTTVREYLIKGGSVGSSYGSYWEDFYARSFQDSDWKLIGRNINLEQDGRSLTEVDLLLVRDDLLLVVEIKALTGSGLSAYDHWKNRTTIEKGCRQARLAADFLRTNPDRLASIADGATARCIRFVQPLVLTTENTYDGWEHSGVPVAGETLRKAITVGTKVTYHNRGDLEAVRTDWVLRPEDLSTATILHALRHPVELELSPERGDVGHFEVCNGDLTFMVPDLLPG